jgi:hypothetical protein
VEGVVVKSYGTARLSGWTAREKGWRTLSLLVVLLVVLGSAAFGLAHVVRELSGGLLMTVAMIGMLAGWAMAARRLHGWLAVVLGFLSGVAVTALRAGRLEKELAAVLWALVSPPWQFWRWVFGGLPPDLAAVPLNLAELGANASALFPRWGYWVLTLIDGHPSFDPVAAALTWSLATWTVATWAGWWVRRRQPLRGVTPAGALLVVTLYYVDASSFSLLPLLGGALVLAALVWQDARERRWRAAQIDFARSIWHELASRVAVLSLVLVLVAALMPLISVQRIVEVVERLTQERRDQTESMTESLGLEAEQEPESETAAFSRVRLAGLPRRHLVGSGPELSRRLVMVVRTGDLRPGLPEPPRRYYWRSITYDRYDGRGWSTSGTTTKAYAAGEAAAPEDVSLHRVVEQEVRVLGNTGDMLHVAGALVSVDQGYRVAWRSPDDAFGATIKAATYRAESLVPAVTEEQLRSAGGNYPDWARAYYLDLPDEVPERVLALARDLTAAAPTPYDRAVTIESYLRTFTYTLDVSITPPDRDIADYFLFDLRQGYCDYYATAMVVLARAAGLPARLVVGYASGTYDADNARFIVTEADAHAWAEVYFPEIGWVEFEPTAGRSAIGRTSEIPPLELLDQEESPGPEGVELVLPGRDRLGWLGWLALPGGLVFLALVTAGWLAADGWWLRRLRPAAAAAMLYGRLRHHGQGLAVPMQAGDTPYEFTASMVERVTRLARAGRRRDLLTPAAREVRCLADFYVQASYTPNLPTAVDRAQAVQTWQRLRWRLWLARVWRRVSRWWV